MARANARASVKVWRAHSRVPILRGWNEVAKPQQANTRIIN